MAMARLFLCVDVHPTREFHEFSGVRPAYGKWPGTSRMASPCNFRDVGQLIGFDVQRFFGCVDMMG